MRSITPSLAMLSLVLVGACGEQSSIVGPRPGASARFDLAAGDQTKFCSGINPVTVTGGSGAGAADPNGFVPGQASVDYTGAGANVGGATANWVVPFGPNDLNLGRGANVDAPDNTTYTYSIEFKVPAGFTADLAGLALRDNSVSVFVDGTGLAGSEPHIDPRTNYGDASDPPSPLAFSTTGLAAGTHTVTFDVWNEDLSNDPGNVGKPFPNLDRRAFNPTGIIFCFTVTPHPIRVTALFVIGDVEDHAVGDNVNFWGAQWWKNNFMSGQVDNGVARFKGYAVQSDGVCGGTWTSLPGNSSNPPDEIPDDVAIIVTTKVLKNGPNISGDIKQIVIVHQDGGYGPNPGHAGNGPVTSVFCTAP